MILEIARPLITLDVETDGYGTPENSRIVEIGFEKQYHDGRSPINWVSLVNPGRPIKPEATEVHHITDAMVSACRECGGGPKLDYEVADPSICSCPIFTPVPSFFDLASHLAILFSDCDYCGYNIRFDIRVLSGEFARAVINWSADGARMIDSFRIWQVAQKRTLSDAVRYFLGREPSSAHRALGDALDARDVVNAQLERYATLPRTVQELHDLCFDKDAVDPDGKFRWREDGVIVCTFGKWKDTPLQYMDKGYLRWMSTGDFSFEVKRLVGGALQGVYPTRRTIALTS